MTSSDPPRPPWGTVISLCAARIKGQRGLCGEPATRSEYGMARCAAHEVELSPCTWAANLDPLTGYCRLPHAKGPMPGVSITCANPEPPPQERPVTGRYAWCFDHGALHDFSAGPWCTARWAPLRGRVEEDALHDKEVRFPPERRSDGGGVSYMRFFDELPWRVQAALIRAAQKDQE